MRRLLIFMAVAVLAGPAAAQMPKDPNIRVVTATPAPPGAAAKPIALTRIRSDVRDDQRVGANFAGVVCDFLSLKTVP